MRRTLPGLLVCIGCLVGGVAFADGNNVRTYQTANLFEFGAPSMILQGAATLFRSQDGADLRVAATHLDPNAVDTVWWSSSTSRTPAAVRVVRPISGIPRPGRRSFTLLGS